MRRRRKPSKRRQPRYSYPGGHKGFDENGEVLCRGCFDRDREIERLRLEVVKLKDEVARLTKRNLFQGAFGANTPSSQKPVKPESKEINRNKKGGAKLGHRGVGRKKIYKTTADVIQQVDAPEICPRCHVALNSCDSRERGVVDVHAFKPRKILYQCKRSRCPKCLKSYSSKPPGVLPRMLYGNELIAQAITLHYWEGVPIGRIIDLFGGAVSEGSLIQAFHRVSKVLHPFMSRIVSDYRKASVKHADETGWRTDGQKGYCWLFCSKDTTLFNFGKRRSGKEAISVFGPNQLPGVLVVDRCPAYNRAPCKIQYCYSHILREIQSLPEKFPDKQEVTGFSAKAASLVAHAIKLSKEPMPDEKYYAEAKRIKIALQTLMRTKSIHPAIQWIQGIFLNNEQRLYHWVENRNVPAHNNQAERELRPTVIARKTSFGSQSKKGAETRSVLTSVLWTTSKRQKNSSPQQWLRQVLDSIAATSVHNVLKYFLPAQADYH
jgi:transposase